MNWPSNSSYAHTPRFGTSKTEQVEEWYPLNPDAHMLQIKLPQKSSLRSVRDALLVKAANPPRGSADHCRSNSQMHPYLPEGALA